MGEEEVAPQLEALLELLHLERVVRLGVEGVVARREAEGVARDRRRVLHQQQHHLLAPLASLDGEMERRVPRDVGGVDVGRLVFDQLQCRLLGTARCAQVQRRL